MTHATSMLMKVEQYLQFRRSLGYQLRVEGRQLQQFAAFADAERHSGPLTTDLAATEPGTELPPRGLLGPAHRRTTPHIHTHTEVAALVVAAGRLSPSGGLRPRTYATLIGLLACTGHRISEALRLTQAPPTWIAES